MIKAKTTFVLGAGASMPYGFPSGAQLRTEIVGAVNPNNWLHNQLVTGCNMAVGEVIEFARAFLRSGVASIDSFLTRRPEFVGIGKLAIATCLCKLENADMLERDANDDHWYRHLWNAMVDGIIKPIDLRGNAVKFITFNYDRSLEAYLYQATKHAYGCSDDEALRFTDHLRPLHVYGQLGAFHYMPGEGRRQYDVNLTPQLLQVAAAGIHIMPEQRGDDPFAMARTMFDWADSICFLGFGFDPLNVERLGLESVLLHKKGKAQGLPQIVASTLQRTRAEIDRTEASLCPSQHWYTYNSQNTMTLRESGVI